MPRQALYSIAPDADFLDTLARRLLDGTLLGDWPRQGPFWLSDVTVVLPTKRARFGLSDALARLGTGILPDIRTFGGEAGDEEPFLPPFDAPPLPPAVGRLDRRLTLSQLIAGWAGTPAGRLAFASPPNAAEMLSLAESLGGLIDDLLTEAVPPERLRAIERDLPANWQETLKFLDIALTAWPEILAGRGRTEAAALRNLRLERQAETAALLYGDRPVIAAGSTGSIPATAALLAAIAGLPRGAIVLPGLDTSLTPDQHARLLDERAAPHGHPQYGLAKLLHRLGATPGAVTELAPGPRPARTLAVRRALALAEGTADWLGERQALQADLPGAVETLSVLAARNQDEEARAIALAARDALSRQQTVAVITPDQNLARRIAAELARFDIVVDDPAGTPLFQSQAGRLARQILAAAVSGFAPVDLMALLHNRAVLLDLPRAELARRAQLLDLKLLRGYRPLAGLDGLRQSLAARAADTTLSASRRLTPPEVADLADLFDRLDRAMAPLCAAIAGADLTPAAFAEGLASAFTLIDGAEATPMTGHQDFLAWAEEAATVGATTRLPARELDALLAALMLGFEVRNPAIRRDDVVILGQLEARLINRDLTILAGLNDDIWPQPADPGPWLSRALRLDIGLEPPERDQGRAAHDFEMAVGQGAVILAFADRLGSSPALPSRFIQRLEAFLGADLSKAMRARGALWCAAARALDAVPEVRPAGRPVPRPSADKRPRRLSITEIETLVRSPYDLYAKHVLGLRPLDPLGEDPSSRERGSMIHAVFARFIEEGRDFAHPDAPAWLAEMAENAFAGLDAIAERRDIWLRRFALAAQRFLDFERPRPVARRHAEIAGEFAFPALDNFTLSGRADRIDVLADGTLEIIDFKTGAVPTPKLMKAFLAPQLLLEAALAGAGGFTAVPPADPSALTYVKIGLGPDAFQVKGFSFADDHTPASAADVAWRRMMGHVDVLLLRDDLPMTARVLPLPGQRFRGAYEHLARTDEWTLTEEEGE